MAKAFPGRYTALNMNPDGARLASYLDRRRDTLISIGDVRPLHRDLELHLLSIGIRHDPETLGLLKDGLAAMALTIVSRPRFESFGWTISLQDPPLNLFFTGSAREGTVIGRAFHENVEPARNNLFIAQTSRPFTELQTSSVEVEGRDIFSIMEQYAARSDQQQILYLRMPEGRVALITPLPDSDRAWLGELKPEDLSRMEESGELKLIAEREISLLCGCDRDRITMTVVDLYRKAPEDLFRGEPAVEAECPRCGTKHSITRESFERFAREKTGGGETGK